MIQVFLGSAGLRLGLISGLGLACGLGCSLEPQADKPLQQGGGHESRYQEGPLQVTIRAKPLSITMADSLELILEAQIEPAWRLQWPRIEKGFLPFRVLSQTRTSRNTKNGKVLNILSLELELDPLVSLDSGATIPALTFQFSPLSSPDLPHSELKTRAIPVEVERLLGDKIGPNQLRPARGPVSLPRVPVWILVLALAALALGLALIGFARRRPSRKMPALQKASPFEEALAAIEALKARGLLQQGKTAAFLDTLAQIIRRYIEGRFGIRAPERTTEEFLHEATQSRDFHTRHKRILSHFLEQADLAKFAKYRPSNKIVLQSFDVAEQFLMETKPSPES